MRRTHSRGEGQAFRNGRCDKENREVFKQPGGIIAHELNHAYRIGELGKPYPLKQSVRDAEEWQAVAWENTYNAANHLRIRCGIR